MNKISKRSLYPIIGIALVTVILFFWWTGQKENDLLTASSSSLPQASSVAAATSTTENHAAIYIDVKGAVKKPGMYRFQGEVRLADAVDAAGGLTNKAAKDKINLAQKLADQTVVTIPEKGEKDIQVVQGPKAGNDKPQLENGASVGAPESSSTTNGEGKINLNQASASDLQKIDGIGAKRAEAIIKYRTEHGSFKQVDDLKNISGIGEKTLAKLKAKVTV